MHLFDTHTHLNMDRFNCDRDAVIQRAKEVGVSTILDVGTDLASSRKVVEICEKYDIVYGAVGIHPHDASQIKPGHFKELEQLLDHPKVVALGEIGLDYHYDYSPRDKQKVVFIDQFELAVEKKKPVVIHIREAMTEGLEILNRFKTLTSGVFHCFGGSVNDVLSVIELGFHISFTGVVTFNNFSKQAIIQSIPGDRILIETDAPYMTPNPHRGKRNEPAFTPFIVNAISQIIEKKPEDLANETTLNACQLFGVGI